MSSGERKRSSSNPDNVASDESPAARRDHSRRHKGACRCCLGVMKKTFVRRRGQGKEIASLAERPWKGRLQKVKVLYAKGVMSLRFFSRVPRDS